MNGRLVRAQSRANASTPYRDSQMFSPTTPDSQGYQGYQGPTSPGATSRPRTNRYQTQPADRPAPNAPSPQVQPTQVPAGPTGGQPSGSPVMTNGLVGPPSQMADFLARNPGDEHRYNEAYTQGGQQGGSGYTAGQLPDSQLPTYQAAKFAQFQDPLNPAIGKAHNDLMLRILQTPESLDPLTIAKMKEIEKEQALQAWGLQQQQIGTDAASRGLSGAGATLGALVTGKNLTDQGIFSAMRGIDIAAAQTNNADRLAAAGMGDQYQSGVMNRGLGGFNATLSGQQAQANDNFRAQQTQADAVNFALQKALAQEQLYQAQAGLGMQAGGLDLQRQSLANSAEQGRLNYGLGLAGLEQNSQGQLLNFIQQILNQRG
jgi:hypothetical protein